MKAGTTQTETSPLLKQYVAGERVDPDLLDVKWKAFCPPTQREIH